MMEKLEKANTNKKSESYPCLLSECTNKSKKGKNIEKRKIRNKTHNTRRKTARKERQRKTYECNKQYIKNLSNIQLTTDQINLLSKGLKFIPTPVTIENSIRHQLMRDFDHFARRMRLRYMYHGENNEPHPFHVKSNWNPPVQPSVTLESYLEEVKLQLAEIEIAKPKNNLPFNEIKAIKELKNNPEVNIKKADKGSTTVIMNKQDKIAEGQIQLNDEENYRPLATPMVEQTYTRVEQLIRELHQSRHIDTMTKKWLSQTANPPRIPEFYTLTKIHKVHPVGRPIISGCEGPTERISSFVDSLLQPIAKLQDSYLKDTTDFINFIENTIVPENIILVSMDVTSLYTNIPQEEGITTVCNAYERFHNNRPPIPTHFLIDMLRLILKENSFQFNGRNYLQIHGTAMGTKMAVSFANLFMAAVEREILNASRKKPLVWKRYIDDVFSLWNISIEEIEGFIEQANRHHPTIKFTAEISDKETIFLDTCVYKGDRFRATSILDVRTHYKPTETFQYTHFSSCHPPGVRKGFIKGEALRLLRTNSSKNSFEDNIRAFRSRLHVRGYPDNLVNKVLSEVKFEERKPALLQKIRAHKRILPFVTQYHPAVTNLKNVLMSKWHLIQNHPSLSEIYRDPPIISYKRGKSLKDILVRSKL